MNKEPSIFGTLSRIESICSDPNFLIRLSKITHTRSWGRLGPEDKFQILYQCWFNTKYPGVLWNHIPNEGKRSKFQAFQVLHFGIRKGMPDVMIYKPRLIKKVEISDLNELQYLAKFKKVMVYSGLAIELKQGLNNLSMSQRKVGGQLIDYGWDFHTCWDFEKAIDITKNYMKDE